MLRVVCNVKILAAWIGLEKSGANWPDSGLSLYLDCWRQNLLAAIPMTEYCNYTCTAQNSCLPAHFALDRSFLGKEPNNIYCKSHYCTCSHYIWKDWLHRLIVQCCAGGTLYTVLSFMHRSSLYAPESLLLISNKFWMGGGEGVESVGEKRGGRVGGGE